MPYRCTIRSQIDADGEDTVGDLKAKIFEAHGHPIDTQKLIYAGTLIRTISKSLTQSGEQVEYFLIPRLWRHAKSRKMTFWSSW